jgi:hypothetical protein
MGEKVKLFVGVGVEDFVGGPNGRSLRQQYRGWILFDVPGCLGGVTTRQGPEAKGIGKIPPPPK